MKTQEKTGEVTEMTNGENGNNTALEEKEVAALTNKKNENKKYQYYSIGWHQFALVIWMVFIALLLIFGLSLFVGGLECVYREEWPRWGYIQTEESEGGSESSGGDAQTEESEGESESSVWLFNLDVLPDFLGGMAGILAGFILEWLVFEKIKNLSKYKTIISCLKIEFEKDLETLRDMEGNKINEIVIDDIVFSAENSVIIYNLPSYFLFRRSKLGGKFLDLLQEIHGNIVRRNKKITAGEKGTAKEDEFDKGGEPYMNGSKGNNKTWAEVIIQDIKTFMNGTMCHKRRKDKKDKEKN